MQQKENPLHNFIDTLFTDTDSIALTNLPEGGHTKTINKTVTKKDLLLFTNPSTIQKLVGQNLNFCICPNPLHPKTRRTADNVKELNTLFLDIDSKNLDINNITPTPHFVFKRNDDHFHIYWLINRLTVNSDTPAKYKKVQQKLVEKYNADKSATDISRLMRLPYTFQIKEKPYTQYKIAVDNSTMPRYDLKEIWQVIKTETPSTGVSSFIDTDEFIIDFIKSDYKDQIFEGEGRSLELFYLGLNCHGWGIPENEAIKIAEWLNENFCQPPESQKIIEHQVKSAYKYIKTEFGEFRNDIKDAGTDKAKRKKLKFYKDCQKVRDSLSDFIYVAGIEQLINLNTGFSLTTKTQIENYIAHICNVSIDLQTIIIKKLIRVVEKIDFRPDIEQRVYEIEGEQYLNRFRGLNIDKENIDLKTKEAEKSVSVFIDHLKFLSTTDQEFTALLNYFAYLIQNPGAKLPYAILIITQLHGMGKSMLEVLFRNILKGYVGSVENEEIGKGWTDYMADMLMVFVHELAQGDRYETMNKFKNLISGSEYLTINGKYARKYQIKNCANFVLFANQSNAIHIEEKDRRLLVIKNEKLPQSKEYYRELYKVFTENFLIIYGFLLSVDLSNFDPYERPAMTAGKQLLIEQSRSELQIFLENLESEQKGPFANRLILPSDILGYMELYSHSILRHRVGTKAVQNYLIDKHYRQLKIEKRISGQRVHKVFWIADNDLKKLTEKDIDHEIIKIMNLCIGENVESKF